MTGDRRQRYHSAGNIWKKKGGLRLSVTRAKEYDSKIIVPLRCCDHAKEP